MQLHENLSQATGYCQQYDKCIGVHEVYDDTEKKFAICKSIRSHPRLKTFVIRKQESFGK